MVKYQKTPEQRLREAYRYAAEQQRKKQTKYNQPTNDQKNKDSAGWGDSFKDDPIFRTVQTGGRLVSNVTTGALKGVEGIVDLVLGIGGGIAGIFSDEAKEEVQDWISFDATEEWIGKHLDDFTQYSYTTEGKVGEIIENVASGVGQMLPTVAVSVATGGAAAPALITTGVSAAGTSTEEAYRDGADYYEGLGYGAVRGATEAATEKLVGNVGGKLFGKGLADDALKGLTKTVGGRIATEAVGEAAEEAASELVNPLTKTIYKGRDALREYGEGDYWKGVGESALVGGLTSVGFGQTVGRAMNAGKNAQISIDQETIRDLNKKYAEGETSVEDLQTEMNEAVSDIEKVLKKATPEKREKWIKNHGLSEIFDEDGTLSAKFTAQQSKSHGGGQTDTRTSNDASQGINTASSKDSAQSLAYQSPSLWTRPGKVDADLGEITESLRSSNIENGGTGDVAPIKTFSGELTEQGQEAFSKLKKAAYALSERTQSGFDLAIVEPNSEFDGVLHNGTMYISADTLENGSWVKPFIEETTHFTEGTKEYAKYVQYLSKDPQLFGEALSQIVDTEDSQKGYGFTEEFAERTIGKLGRVANSIENKVDLANGADGEVLYFSKKFSSTKNAEGDDSIKQQLSEHVAEINNSNPVYEVSYTPMNKKTLHEKISEEFRAIGYKVDRKDFGVIEIGEKQIDKSINYLNTEGEKAALFSIPAVLKRGKEISGHPNHKGRGYDTITIAAKIIVNDAPGVVAAVVTKIDGKNKYRVHRILTPDGSEFVFKNKDAQPTSGEPSSNKDERAPIGSASIDSIPDSSEKVNTFEEETLSEKERELISEWNAHASAEMLGGDEAFVDKLIRENTGLAQKMLNHIKDLAKAFERMGDPASRAEYQRLKKAEKLFLKAVSKAGGQYVNGKIVMRREEEEVNDFEKLNQQRRDLLEKKTLIDAPWAEEFSTNGFWHVDGIRFWKDINTYRGKEKQNRIFEIAKAYNVFKNYQQGGLSFIFTHNNFRESYNKQGHDFADFAKMFSVFDSVVNQAIKIEEQIRVDYKKDPTLKKVHVFMSAFTDGERTIPVKLEVKEFLDKQNTLYVAITSTATKKAEVWKQGTTENGVAQNSRSATVSITELMKNVNPKDVNFTKYFPTEFLTLEQQNALNEAGIKQLEKNVPQFSRVPSVQKKTIEKQKRTIERQERRIEELENNTRQGRGGLYEGEREKLWKKIQDISNLKKDTYLHASQISDHPFRTSFENITKIYWQGARRDDTKVRLEFEKIRKWYTDPQNRLYRNEDGSWTEDFRQDVYNALENLANGKGNLSLAELKSINELMTYFKLAIEHHNKVFEGGKWIEASEIAKKYYDVFQRNKKLKNGTMTKFQRSKYFQLFGDFYSVMQAADKYDPNGIYTSTFLRMEEGELQALIDGMNVTEERRAFLKKNKKYIKRLTEETVEYQGQRITVDEATYLYMLHKSQDAWNALVRGGIFTQNAKGDRIEFPALDPTHDAAYGKKLKLLKPIVDASAERLLEQFTETDKKWIELAEKEMLACKKLKSDTDMIHLGTTNVIEGYYVPIYRADLAKTLEKMGFMGEMNSITDPRFNKTRVSSSNRLLVKPLSVILNSHVRGVCLYANLSVPIKNFNRLLNVNLSDNFVQPKSMRSEIDKSGYDKEAIKMLEKLVSDLQGKGTDGEKFYNDFARMLRSGYAVSAMGLNLKVMATQGSSYLAAANLLDYNSLVRGWAHGASGEEVDKYCPLAKLRNVDDEAIKARTVSDSVSRFGQALMKGISITDRLIVKRLYAACKVEVQSKHGLKIGTEENSKAAGDLLTMLLLRTQQNNLLTGRSSAMRSNDELLKSTTMFSADAMKQNGRWLDDAGSLSANKARLNMDDLSEDERKRIEAQVKKDRRHMARASSVLATNAIYSAVIALAFSWLYGRLKDKDEEDLAWDVVKDMIGNTLGGLPVLRDVYSLFSDGYELDTFAISTINDILLASKESLDLCLDAVGGKKISEQQVNSTVRNLINGLCQVFGIPSRNAYNLTVGITGHISPSTGYWIDSQFYKQRYASELAKAIEKGDEKMVTTIATLITEEQIGSESEETLSAVRKLVESGYVNVFPKVLGDTVTYDGEEIELTAEQKNRFREVYDVADESLDAMVQLKQFKNADQAIQAKAIRFIYDTYYDLAVEDLVGAESGKNTLFAEAIDLELLALIICTARTMTAGKDKNGKSISGSKKDKVIAYIESLSLPAAKKYMVLGYLGYKNLDGEAKVKMYVNTLKLTKAEKQRLLEYSGYTAA